MKKFKDIILGEVHDWIFGLLGVFPGRTGRFIRRQAFSLFFNCGERNSFARFVTISGKNVRIGSNNSIEQYCSFHAKTGTLEIGNYCSFSQGVWVSADMGRVTIGDNVLIGPYTLIRAANHKFDETHLPIRRQGHIFDEIIIEDDVWIGGSCIICPGVKISTGTVIGAGSVVTKSTKKFQVVFGNPASVRGSRVG